MEEIIRVNEQFYILASSSPADELRRVLKHGDSFAVFDHFGNIRPAGLGEQGLYHEGTRHLSQLELRIENRRPLLLSSTVREDNALLVVSVTNPDFHQDGDGFVEYSRRSTQGLGNQGWKDSYDSVFHADGTLADAPIALCEV